MSQTNAIPERDQISLEETWNLTDLYADDAAWQAEFEVAQTYPAKLSAYAGRLGESGRTLLEYFTLSQEASVLLLNLANYAYRKGDQDTRVAQYQAMEGKISSLAVEINGAMSFETPEILAIDPAKLEEFMKEEPGLELYRRYLTIIQDQKAHVLSDAEEKLLAAVGDLAHAPEDIFGKLTDADLTFPSATDGEGREVPLSNGAFVPTQMSEDRVLRKNAFETFYGVYGSVRNTAAAVLNAEAKQRQFYANARKYPSALAAAVAGTRVPESVYHNLISTVNANLDKMHRYIRLPMVSGGEKVISYEQAKDTVFDALAPMGDKYRAIIREGFDNRWIDVRENVGKRSGAYSAGALCHPYVLLNHKDNLESMFTLAHEMGHAAHSYLSNRTQEPVYRDYVIFVAEVASTCNEALLMEYLLQRTTDKKERAALINHFLEQFKGTLYRQTMFAEFELRMGQLCAQGEPLTADLLSKEYKALNEKYYGPDMVSDDQIALEWARIPHFYYNYYVYQYATGYSAAIALSRRILKGEEGAVEDYLGFLSGGCSKDPIDLLKGAGVDMSSPAPIQDALDLFGTLLDEMEKLMED